MTEQLPKETPCEHGIRSPWACDQCEAIERRRREQPTANPVVIRLLEQAARRVTSGDVEQEAADMIERLRAEVERLRAALERIYHVSTANKLEWVAEQCCAALEQRTEEQK